jgi:hypothetical protein
MPKKWAVLVVHGVGDTGPGVTVDTFLSSLTPERPRLRPDGRVEVHLLPDTQPPQKPLASNITTSLSVTFPMHVRRAVILPPSGGPDGSPEEAVFAEVYWADLSTLRQGTIYLILGLLSSVFSLRYLADQAAVMPPEDPGSRWPEKLARSSARWLRFILHLTAALLCGPIAGLSALLACVMVGDALVYPGLSKLVGTRELFEVILSTLAGLGGLAWAYASRQTSTTTWTRFWFCFGLAAIIGSMIMIWKRSVGTSVPFPAYVNNLVNLQFGSSVPRLEAISRYSAGIYFVLQLSYLLMVSLMFAALIFWAIAFAFAPVRWRPALGAAFGASIVQLGLWLVIMPPLIMLGIGTFRPSSATLAGLASFLENIQIRFGVQLLFILLVAVIAIVILVKRVRWARTWLKRNTTRPPYTFPTSPPDITRLLVNAALIGGIIVVATMGGVVFVTVFFLGLPRSLPVLGVNLISLANVFSSMIVTLLVFAIAVFAQGLRDGLHVLTDVINHFFRRRDPFPLPWGTETPAPVQVFETQQRIEHRFKAVLNALLEDPEVTHMTIVSHSQGTMIAIDVFSLTGLSSTVRSTMTARLETLTEFHLVTMGSPLTHLYEHYFPFRYPPLISHAWGGLKQTIKHWINVYRVDDYVGTFITPVPGWMNSSRTATVLLNVPIDPGGHIGYWRQPAVFSLSPIKETLPGS